MTDQHSQYRYHSANGQKDGGPTFWICIMFLGLFGLSTTLHVGQGIYWRKWFMLPTMVMGGIGEIIAWAARLVSSKQPDAVTPFTVQISTAIFAPTFLSAANFIMLGQIIRNTRTERYSRLSARNYSIIFLTADTIALTIQGVGGGLASSQPDPDLGGHIMLAGIVIQLIAILAYLIIAVEYLYRLHKDRPFGLWPKSHKGAPFPEVALSTLPTESTLDLRTGAFGLQLLPPRMQLMLAGLAFSSILLLIRAFYRLAELAGGWTGEIIETEWPFNVFDGGMVVLAMYTINFIHPGLFLD